VGPGTPTAQRSIFIGICELLTFNCTKMRSAAGLCPDPLGELTALPIPSGWILGVGAGKEGEGKGGGKGKGGG